MLIRENAWELLASHEFGVSIMIAKRGLNMRRILEVHIRWRTQGVQRQRW